MLKMFSAWVKDKNTKEYLRIDSEYKTKTDFISDLRSNGYSVSSYRVKEKVEFDRIINETDCNIWDWKGGVTNEY